jgi:NAD(P)-dependent dehydrogenase (short-subunit alcohol dehydrogenase family)
MPKRDLTGKVCIVTGAGSGLGKAMALGLAESGAIVAGFDINLEAAQSTANETSSGKIKPFQCDITSQSDVEDSINSVISTLDGLNVLINCAGLGMSWIRRDYLTNRLNFWDTEPEKWQAVMDVNVRGAFLMARTAAPYLMNQNQGRIVNVTTSLNTMIRGGNMPYGQSKASLEAATASWAEDFEVAGSAVTANVLVPGGAADTPMVPHESPYNREQLVKPEAMVAPAIFLASDDSKGINSMRFLGRLWDPGASDAENIKASGAAAAWPELAAAAGSGQPKAQ